MKHFKKENQGFTLIEVMVALVIVAVALPALLTQTMTLMDSSASLQQKTIARWIAQNQYVYLQLQQQVEQQELKGRDSGSLTMVGRDWQWSVTSKPTSFSGLQDLQINVGTEVKPQIFTFQAYIEQ